MNRSARFLAYKAKRIAKSESQDIREWDQLAGKYSGKRAFAIGNGPSLNQTQLYLLKDEYTICFNRWDLMLERLNWNPTFYAVSDDRVLADTIDVANAMSDEVEYAFFPDIHPYNVDFRGSVEKKENVRWLYLDLTSFSNRLPHCGMNKTVVNVGLQILAHLGFKEVYLLGVDMTYSVPSNAKLNGSRDLTATEDNDDSHFDPRYFGAGRKFHTPMLDEAFVKFREAREYFHPRGMTIRNATVGGVLEEFDRITLDDVLGFSEAEKRDLFVESVYSKLKPNTLKVEDVVHGDPDFDSLTDVDEGTRCFTVASDLVNKYVKSHVSSHVPFGPFEGKHLFVHRDLLA